jgi:hypothetical protein
MTDWTDLIVGDRMAVDRSFNEELNRSSFTRAEWGLVMTAVQFDIEHADDPERASLVGNTDRLPDVLPELKRVAKMQQMGPDAAAETGSSGGLFGGVKKALGLGNSKGKGVDEEKVTEAKSLVASYTDQLQLHLEENGKWERVREEYLAA